VKKWSQAAREMFKFRQNNKRRSDFASKSGRRFSPQLERLEERTLLSVSPLVSTISVPPVISQPLWSSASNLTTTAPPLEASYTGVSQAELFSLNSPVLESTTLMIDSNSTISVPTPSGDFERFEIVEAPILAPELAAKYPEIATYRGQGVDDPSATIRFDVTETGLHAMILSPEGAYYVTPYSQGDASLYLSYDAGEYSSITAQDIENDLVENDSLLAAEENRSSNNLTFGGDANSGFYGETLTTYGMAVSASGEFTANNGGTVSSALSAITTGINWVNGIYENELAMRFQILAGSDAMIYTNAATDPYDITQSNTSMLNQNQSNVDSVFGNANYDIGHLFINKSNFGGVATLASAGVSSMKAEGISGNTEGFTTAHEIGHQFNAHHTWNGDGTGNLSDPNNPFNSTQYDAASSMEPGAGTTIMSYGNLASSDENIQGHRDEYFHAKSLEQISTHATAHPPVVGSTVSTGNSAPTVNAGGNYVIPADTPFTLTASGSDSNGDPVTYSWEQFNADNAQSDLSSADDGVGPLFRSWPAISDSSRTFPNVVDLAANTTPVGELLPSLARTMDFRITARDNHPGAGAYAYDDMSVQVVATGSAFQVTSPNTAVTYSGGSTQTVTWDVAGTTANGINVSDVAIKLSTDGGLTYPFSLATTTNDGSYDLSIPNIDATNARIRVEAVGNVFFDISDADITITSTPGIAGVGVIETGGSTHVEEAGFTDTYDLQLNTAPTGGPVTIEITGNSQVEISTDGSTFAATGSVILSDTSAVTITVRAINDALEEGLDSTTITHAVTASGSAEYPVGMPVNEVNVTLADDELPPVVGIDFDYPAGTYTPEAPSHWELSHTAIYSHTFTDMTRDDGAATPFDLTFSSGGGWGYGYSTIFEQTVPVHSIDLDPLLGMNVWIDPVSLVWSDLTPGTQYEIYIFGTEGYGVGPYTISQTVTITGSGIDNPAPFFQDSTSHDNELLVNDQVGSWSQNLTDYAKTVTADVSGQVTVAITPDPGQYTHLAGLAIREVAASNAAPTDIALSNSSVDENEPSGTAVGTLSTTDPDAGDSHTYALVAGAGDADNASFTIVGDELQTSESFDFETKDSYSIRVKTTDSGTETYEKSLTITVTDVNEAPSVSLQNTVTSLPEDQSMSSALIVADILVTDDALGTNGLSLSGTDAASFEIAGTELRLKAGVPLDFETQAQYNVTVEVDDTTVGTTPDDTSTLTITITDVNEPPTIALQNTTTTLPEDQDTTAALKVADIVVTDDALGTNDITLTGADASLFEFTGLELFLKAGVSLDHETNPQLDVTVQVDDTTVGTTPDDTAPLTITITDVNDPPAPQSATMSVLEPGVFGQTVGTVQVTDQDLPTQSLTFAITAGNTNNAFAIHPTSGLITVFNTGEIDHEVTPTYLLTVEVTDNGAPVETGQCIITVNIIDAPALGTISGTVYHDENVNATYDTPAELPLEGWTVFLDEDDDGVLDPGELSDLTDVDGEYIFVVPPAGTYQVTQLLPEDWAQTTPEAGVPGGVHEVVYNGTDVITGLDFGNAESTAWASAFGESTGNPGDGVNAVAVDATGAVYAVGTRYGFGDLANTTGRSFIRKYAPGGDLLWENALSPSTASHASDVAIDGQGDVYFSGSFLGTNIDFDPRLTHGDSSDIMSSSGSYDAFLLKLDSNGDFIWVEGFGGGSAGEWDYSYGLAIDDSDNVYMSGSFSSTADFDHGDTQPGDVDQLTSNGLTDGFIVKVDAAGDFQWVWGAGGTDRDSTLGLAVDSVGNVHAGGVFYNSVDFDGDSTPDHTSNGSGDAFFVDLDSNGAVLYSASIGGTGYDQAIDVDMGPNDERYYVGRFQGTVDFDPSVGGTDNRTVNGGFDAFALALDSSNNHLWSYQVGAASDDMARAVDVNDEGYVFIGGEFMWEADFHPSDDFEVDWYGSGKAGFILGLTEDGNYVSSGKVDDDLGGADSVRDIAFGPSRSIVYGGYFSNTAKVTPNYSETENYFTLTSNGGYDAFVANYPVANDVFLYGTTGDDTVNIWPGTQGGADHRIDINGVSHYYDASIYEVIYVDGLDGNDTISIFGTSRNEEAAFDENFVYFFDSTFNFRNLSFENIYAYGSGGNDDSYMMASDGDDRFYGNETYSYLRGDSNAYFNYVKNFDSLIVDGSSGLGFDRAYIYDGAGDEIYDAESSQVTLLYDSTGTFGPVIAAKGFDETSIYAVNGGNDVATLHGSDGNDKFTARDIYGRMRGDDGAYIHYAEGFDLVTGDASGTTGTDTAILFDGPGDDYLQAGETSTSLQFDSSSGGNPNLVASGFDQTYGYAIRGGDDTALMTGSANNDRFTSKQTYSTLKRQDGGYFNYAAGWDQVTGDVSGGGGTDLAFIYDAATDDAFEAGPTQATIDYDATPGSPDIETTAIGFGEVYAYADFGGNDSAILNGSVAADKLYGLTAYSYLKAADDSFFNYARGFDTVTANAVGTGDIAFLYGSNGNDVLNADANSAVFTLNPTAAPQTVNTAAAFDQVYAYASGGGTDQAYLNGTAGNDTLAADTDWGSLRSTGATDYFNYVRYFDEVFADPGDTDVGNDTLDDRGATYTLDTTPGNGNVW
jgi:hypothetical protein